MKKKVIIGAILAFLILSSGITYAVVQHNNQVQARELVQKKQEEQEKKETANLKTAETAVDQAYYSRKETDIEAAKKAVGKLSDKQNTDKTKLNEKLTKLNELLKQLSELNTALDKATKSKSDADMKTVQNLLDKMTNDYLKNDKVVAQKKITSLEEQVKKEADEKNKAVADAEAAKQIEVNQTAQTPTEPGQASDQSAYTDQVPAQQQQEQPTYQAPAQQQQEQPAYQAPAQQTPSQPNYQQPIPSQPSPNQPTGPNGGNGTPNGAGIVDSPGGWDTPGNVGMGPWQ